MTIPTSATCNVGVGPSMCVSVPPSPSSALADRIEVDGVKGGHEWDGATVLPYTDIQVKATGKIYLRVASSKFLLPGSLYVYLEDIPVHIKTPGLLGLFIDYRRFTGTANTATSEDRVYAIGLLPGGEQLTIGFWTPGQVPIPVLVDEPFDFAHGECKLDPSMAQLYRCSAELRLPLRHDAFVPPSTDLQPGIGLGVVRRYGAMPEEAAWWLVQDPLLGWPWFNRAFTQTLLLGPPHGFPVRYMSWNVRRSAVGPLVGPFSVVTPRDIGEYLYPYDVVAVQEGWNLEQMSEVLFWANEKRDQEGLPPMHAYGPVDFEETGQAEVAGYLGTVVYGDEGTTGGLWVLSHLPSASTGSRPFTACQGEDCMKAKGVQWVRLYLNPPSATNSDPACTPSFSGPPPAGCDPAPSGDHYIDVFNTHLQASAPEICDSQLLQDALDMALSSIPLNPSLWWYIDMFIALQMDNWHCDIPTRTIHEWQLDEVNDFIDDATSEDPDRPVIIMGDFNIDGRRLDLDPEYGELLKRLRIASSILTEPPFATGDIINPWPYDFSWDVDHGDLARERDIDWSTGNGTGTSIGDDGGTVIGNPGVYCQPEPSCDFADDFDGGSRLDYVLVRPPLPADVSEDDYKSTSWVAMQIEDERWESPWPGDPDEYGPPPLRLSDHKPVVVTIVHAPLVVPPKYHPTWRHTVEFRVMSADATGVGDCIGCDQIDPYSYQYGKRYSSGQWVEEMVGFHGNECTNDQSVSWPVDDCMVDWRYRSSHDPPADSVHHFITRLFEDDDGPNSDDWLFCFYMPPDDPREIIEWNTGKVKMRGRNLPAYLSPFTLPPDDWTLVNNEPVSHCTGSSPVKMCIRVDPDELPPGEQ